MQIRVLFPTVTLSRTIEGQDLWQIIKTQRQPLDETTAIHYMKQVAEAVVYLHRQQPPIIHRDIKPQNIKITPQGQAVLVDFGIAKMAEVGERTTTGAQGVMNHIHKIYSNNIIYGNWLQLVDFTYRHNTV